jgi:hypothetical protein
MKTALKLLFLLSCIAFFTPSVSAQKHHKRLKKSKGLRMSFSDSNVDSLESSVVSDGFLYGGFNFMNQVNYLGRDNNLKQWAINPVLGVQIKDFNVYVNGFRWSETSPKYVETDLGISKMCHISKPLDLETTYEHAFIHYGTDEDKYSLNNNISTQLTWTNAVFDANVNYQYDWGKQNATTLELSIGHEVDLYDVFTRDKVEIDPHFYVTYLGGNTYPIRLFSTKPFLESGSEGFKIANYELSLPITWRKIGVIDCNLTFNYAIPKNVFTEEGSGKPLFYVSASVIKIGVLKHRQHNSMSLNKSVF